MAWESGLHSFSERNLENLQRWGRIRVFTPWNLQKCFPFTLNMCNKAFKADVIVWWGSWLQSRGCLSTQDHQSFDQTPTGTLRTFLFLRLLSNILLSCSEEPPGEKQDIFWCLRPYKTVDTTAFTTLCVFLIRFSVIYLKMLYQDWIYASCLFVFSVFLLWMHQFLVSSLIFFFLMLLSKQNLTRMSN